MKRILLAAALVLPVSAHAGTLGGAYQTEAGDTGKVAHVEMAPCASDANLTCGTMVRAYNADGSPDQSNENIGKLMVWDMEDRGNGKYGGGKIWDPSKDKVYDSKMSISGSTLTVKGCIAFICRGQNWVAVP